VAEQTPEAAPGTWVDPYPAYNFKVVIRGQTVAHFLECSGIGASVGTMEYREAGQLQVVHQIPTITTYNDVTLSYGLTASPMMWDWFLATTQGKVRRENVSIMMLDPAGSTNVLHWVLNRAFPKCWDGAVLRATAREIAIAKITLAYESLDKGAI
jgi:phage tail-like protein